LDDLDSRMFSLIVDEIVDPEEVYRQQVRDFMAELETMPRISAAQGSPAHLFSLPKLASSVYFV
ncbi:hypothetical protein IWW52_005641, partial [Coemansia sp. RSA 2704]